MDAPRQGVIATAVSVGRLHIVAIAALGCFTFGWLFTGHYPVVVTVICARSTGSSSTCSTASSTSKRTRTTASPAPTSSRATDGRSSTAASRCSASRSSSRTLVRAAAPAVSPRLSPARLRLQLAAVWPAARIKQLYFWKNTASAMGFMLTVFCYPLAWARGQLWYGITLAHRRCHRRLFFLFELSYEVIYDLRDAPGDARADVRTYPVVHGAARRRRASSTRCCIASLAVLAGGFAAHVVPWRIAILGVGPLLQIFLYKRFVKRGITSRDCINLTWLGAALLVAYHGWVLAGLPGRDVMLGARARAAPPSSPLYAVARRDAPARRSALPRRRRLHRRRLGDPRLRLLLLQPALAPVPRSRAAPHRRSSGRS